MGNASFSVFQACRCLASVFSIARCFLCRILVRRQITQAAVRTLFVILRPPLRDLALGIEQVLKPAHVQTLFSQPSVKALHPRILRRLPRLNMHDLDLPLHAPRQKMPTGEPWPVVAADRTRPSALGPDLVQHARHSATGETRIHFQRQTLSRVGIDEAMTDGAGISKGASDLVVIMPPVVLVERGRFKGLNTPPLRRKPR